MPTKYERNRTWREKYPSQWRASKKRNYDKGAVDCINSGQIWTRTENLRILAIGRPRDRILSLEIGRSVRAIQKQRSLIRKWESRGV